MPIANAVNNITLRQEIQNRTGYAAPNFLIRDAAFGKTTAEDWFNEGLALHDQGNLDDAIAAYDKAINIDPNLAQAWSNKGATLHLQGKYDEAIQALDKAIQIDPQVAQAWYNKGIALEALGKTSESEATFAKAKELGYSSSTPTLAKIAPGSCEGLDC